jgi:hypothetical protein
LVGRNAAGLPPSPKFGNQEDCHGKDHIHSIIWPIETTQHESEVRLGWRIGRVFLLLSQVNMNFAQPIERVCRRRLADVSNHELGMRRRIEDYLVRNPN